MTEFLVGVGLVTLVAFLLMTLVDWLVGPDE
jgi:hypothetical protein